MQGIYEDDEETNAMYGVPGAGGGRSPFAPAEDYADLAGARRFALGRQSSWGHHPDACFDLGFGLSFADALYCDNDLDDDESDLEDDDLKQDPRFAPPLEVGQQARSRREKRARSLIGLVGW